MNSKKVYWKIGVSIFILLLISALTISVISVLRPYEVVNYSYSSGGDSDWLVWTKITRGQPVSPEGLIHFNALRPLAEKSALSLTSGISSEGVFSLGSPYFVRYFSWYEGATGEFYRVEIKVERPVRSWGYLNAPIWERDAVRMRLYMRRGGALQVAVARGFTLHGARVSEEIDPRGEYIIYDLCAEHVPEWRDERFENIEFINMKLSPRNIENFPEFSINQPREECEYGE